MLRNLEPKQIEKNIIFMQSRDGILDMLFGLMMVSSGINGIYTFMDWVDPWYIRYMTILLLVPMLMAKFLLTAPRIGYIKMKTIKGGRRSILHLFLIVSMTITILMLSASIFKISFIHGQTLNVRPVILFGAILLIMSFIAWLIGLYSLYIVGLSTGIGFFLDESLGLETIFSLPGDVFIFLIPGILVTIYGAFRLTNFLKSHPRTNVKADFEHE